MLIRQILNNNILVVDDPKGGEKIVWGRGIGFHHRPNQNYEVQGDDRIFVLDAAGRDEWLSSFEKLSNKVPREYFELAEEVIEMAEMRLNVKVDTGLIVQLTDHMYFTVQRLINGVQVDNPLLNEISHFFKPEFEIGKITAQKMAQLSGIPIPDDEAGFIAIHIIEGETHDGANQAIHQTTQVMAQIGTIESLVQAYAIHGKIAANELVYVPFLNHLRILLIGILGGRYTERSTIADSKLLRSLTSDHPRSNRALEAVTAYIESQTKVTLSATEQLLLIVYIIRLIE